jgi:hypothetical protein
MFDVPCNLCKDEIDGPDCFLYKPNFVMVNQFPLLALTDEETTFLASREEVEAMIKELEEVTAKLRAKLAEYDCNVSASSDATTWTYDPSMYVKDSEEQLEELEPWPDCPTGCETCKERANCSNVLKDYQDGDDWGDAPKEDVDFRDLGAAVGEVVQEKNEAYGDSFVKCGEFLKLLYPEAVYPGQYVDMLALVRIFDKQMRIATNPLAFSEEPWKDIAGYGLLGMKQNLKE